MVLYVYGNPCILLAMAASASGNVKTTVDLPQELWRAAKIRAMDEHTDLRSVVIAALGVYLQVPLDAAKTAT
jgi:hypothetical protein